MGYVHDAMSKTAGCFQVMSGRRRALARKQSIRRSCHGDLPSPGQGARPFGRPKPIATALYRSTMGSAGNAAIFSCLPERPRKPPSLRNHFCA